MPQLKSRLSGGLPRGKSAVKRRLSGGSQTPKEGGPETPAAALPGRPVAPSRGAVRANDSRDFSDLLGDEGMGHRRPGANVEACKPKFLVKKAAVAGRKQAALVADTSSDVSKDADKDPDKDAGRMQAPNGGG